MLPAPRPDVPGLLLLGIGHSSIPSIKKARISSSYRAFDCPCRFMALPPFQFRDNGPPRPRQGHTHAVRLTAQALGQLAGLLHQHVRGHNRQVEGQQLVAPDSLGRVALAVIPQELPGGERGKEDRIHEGDMAMRSPHWTPAPGWKGLPCSLLTPQF